MRELREGVTSADESGAAPRHRPASRLVRLALLASPVALVLCLTQPAAAVSCKPPKVNCGGVCKYKSDCKRSSDGNKKRAKKRKACRKSAGCVERGICGINRKGACEKATAKGCAASRQCKKAGLCAPAKDKRRCEATKPEHCAALPACLEEGLCSPSAGACRRVSSRDCQRSKLCSRDGLCGLAGGRCVAVTVADCRGSERCRAAGRCELFSGSCQPGCPSGRVRTSTTKGLCCWPGQRASQGRCSGTPTRCPSGMTASRGRCVRATGPPKSTITEAERLAALERQRKIREDARRHAATLEKRRQAERRRLEKKRRRLGMLTEARNKAAAVGEAERLAGYVLCGVGGAAAVVGGIVTLTAHLKADEINDAILSANDKGYVVSTTMTQVEAVELKSAAQTEEVVGGVMLGLSGALLVTGVVLLAIAPTGTVGADGEIMISAHPLAGGGMIGVGGEF